MENLVLTMNGYSKNRKQLISHARHENINRIVQMYAGVLSNILLGKNLLHDVKEIRLALNKVNHLILKHPGVACYTRLKGELIHLKDLIVQNSRKTDLS